GGGRGDQPRRALGRDPGRGRVLGAGGVFPRAGATAPGTRAKNSHASPTPRVRGERLFVHFGHQGTACLDLSGKVLWRNTDLKYEPVHGNGGSPILVEDALIFNCDGYDKQFVAALDANNGKVLWQTDRNSDAV